MNKKQFFKALFFALPIFGTAQVFQEDFDGNGPGFSAWTVLDVDGLTPASPVSEIIGWVSVDRGGPTPNYGGPDNNHAAASTSYYNPSGVANDWLISPQITVSGTSPFLLWDAKAADPNFSDGYKVMLSPNGGNTVSDFTVELFSTPTENATWKSRFANLSSYVGQTVRVAFVNNSSDKFVLLVDNIKVDEYTPVALPNCATLNLPANGATNVDFLTGVDFSWTPPADLNVDEYDFYIDTNPNPTTYIGTTPDTSVRVNGLTDGGTTYYWKVVPKNSSGSASGCTVFSFTTSETPVAPYCGPLDFTFNVEPITTVSFGGMTNVSDAALNNSPAHELFLDKVANVTAGSNETITLKGNTNGPWESSFAVFIDWNQNGNFNDEGETYEITQTLAGSDGEDDKEITQVLAVPADAKAGTTRMRVKKNFGPNNLLNPCVGGSFGQAEEYSVNVGSLGTTESVKGNVKFYPNPVQDVLNLEADANVKNITVYDISGKLMMSKKLNSAKNQVNVSALLPGVYVVNAELENGVKTFKIIKK
jgi:hypothetical protein